MEKIRSDYYVYLHRRSDNGVVFYVGKGTGGRAWESGKRRNKCWLKVTQESGFHVEIYKSNLTESAAHALESDLICFPNKRWDLVNKHKTHNINEIDISLYQNYVIDRSSPSGVSRIAPSGELIHCGYKALKYNSTEPAHWVIHRKYGKKVVVHRLVMELLGVHLEPYHVINHINCNPLDNRIENLEICTQSDNCKRNRTTLLIKNNPLNTSGITGVMEVTNVNRGLSYTYAMATWSENGKSKSKKFSYNKYTKELAWQLAIEWRKQMVKNFYEVQQ